MNHAGEAVPVGFPMDLTTGIGFGEDGGRPLHALAIVGSHPETREKAPYEDPDFDVWLFNEAPQRPDIYRRWDACLQIHKPEVYSSLENWVNKDHWAWLQQDHGNKRIYMQDVDERVPNSVKYPLDGVLSLVPYKYLRSSPAMALALGIYLGYKRIDLYGSELSSNTEYTYQAINYAFWIGFAHGLGVDLRLECWHNEFYMQPIYGFEGELQIDKDYFEQIYKEHKAVWEMKDNAYQKLQNKLEDAMLKSQFDKVAELSLALETAAINTGEIYGKMREAQRYMERTNEISRQEFERVAAQSQIDGEGLEKDMHHEAGKAEYVWNVWRQTGSLEALNQLRTFLDTKIDLAFDMGKKLGRFRENMAFRAEYDQRVTAAGGERAKYQVQKMDERSGGLIRF